MKKEIVGLLLIVAGSLFQSRVHAADILPYTIRTHAYDGMRPSAQGDLRTVGMAGGNVGLGNTYLTTLYNPAGLAMSLNGADASLAENRITDGSVQSSTNSLSRYTMGLAFAPYPWGFGFFYRSSPLEAQSYNLSSGTYDLKVATSDYNFSFSRMFFDDRLSLGAGLTFGQAQESLEGPGGSFVASGAGVGGMFGASWQFPRRWILGFGVSTPMQYSVASNATAPLAGFFQSIEVPYRLGLGLGWMPNRFFRTDFSMFLVGASQNAALLRDDTVRVGRYPTLQPKFGMGYQFVDWRELRVTLNLGTYLEISRTDGLPNRLHFTSSIEVSPWILFCGFGMDASDQYLNSTVSLGLNVIKAMEKLDMIPPLSQASQRGLAPNPIAYNDNGLPRALVKGPMLAPEIDPLQIGLNIPGRFGQKVEDIGSGIVSVPVGISNGIGSFFKSAVGTSRPSRKFKEKKTRKRKIKARGYDQVFKH